MNRFTRKNPLKSFLHAPESHKRQLTGSIEFTSGSSLIGRSGVPVIPRNHLVSERDEIAVAMRACLQKATAMHPNAIFFLLHCGAKPAKLWPRSLLHFSFVLFGCNNSNSENCIILLFSEQPM